MISGLGSNCWGAQFAQNESLESLIARAVENGFQAVELRQGSLGAYEDAQQIPAQEPLAQLAAQFPEVRFNLAISIGFLSPDLCPDDPLFVAACAAACAVTGAAGPHLRLVDLHTTAEEFATTSTSQVATNLVRLAGFLNERGGRLSVEHSLQPWGPFLDVFAAARALLGPAADCLQLCFDPCNLLFPDDHIDPLAVTGSLDPQSVSMIHFKQRQGGQVLDRMAAGELDWRALSDCIVRQGFDCPGLFEIAPGPRVWSALESSRNYLQRSGLPLDSR